jgi:hypothetical protein
MLPNGLFKITEIGTIASIAPKFLWYGFGILLVLVTIISLVLLYHWVAYGYKHVKTSAIGALYFSGVLVLMGVIFFAIISYTATL